MSVQKCAEWMSIFLLCSIEEIWQEPVYSRIKEIHPIRAQSQSCLPRRFHFAPRFNPTNGRSTFSLGFTANQLTRDSHCQKSGLFRLNGNSLGLWLWALAQRNRKLKEKRIISTKSSQHTKDNICSPWIKKISCFSFFLDYVFTKKFARFVEILHTSA